MCDVAADDAEARDDARREQTPPPGRLVARRGRLPGLRPQLRRRERRRDRRPGRRAVAAAIPARPRRRRALVQPLVPVAAGRQRLRRRRLPLDRSRVRDPRGGGGADRGRARPRDPHDRRRRPEPRLERAPLVPRRARRRPGLAGALALLVPARRRRRRRGRRTGGSRSSAGRRGRAVDDGEWYLHLFAPEQPDLNWTHPDVWAEHEDVLRFWFDRGVAGVRIDSAALLVKDPGLGESAPTRRPASTRTWTATSCTTSTAAGARSPTATPEPRVLIGELWLPEPSGSSATCARTSCTPRSTSTTSRARGSRRGCAPRSTPRSTRMRRSTRRRRG